MSNIILVELLDVLDDNEVVRIYKERKHKSEGYRDIITIGAKDLLESDEDYLIALIDSNIRVTSVGVRINHEFGWLIEIYVKEIGNESK